jgi:hypothetical protein
MSEEGFIKYWTEVGVLVAHGGKMNRSDLYAIYDVLGLGGFDLQYLPDGKTIAGNPVERKEAMFGLAEKIWGLTPGDWLAKEKAWLDESRLISGSLETSGKDKISDVISVEILLRIVAAARFVTETNDGYPGIDEAILALNTTLAEVCAKGRTRMMIIDGNSVYSQLKSYGLMIGTGGGKYLPYPDKALPELLLLMLDRKRINPAVYLP